jgi:drug/metabolite transporter (DMT)-like permease
MTASGYVLTAILGQVFLNEGVSFIRWAGIALISFGVVLVAETGPRTVHESDGPPR